MIVKHAFELFVGKLHAAIRVKDCARLRAAVNQCRHCRVKHLGEMPGNDLARVQIHDGAQVVPTFADPYVGDITYPDLVGLCDRCSAQQQISGISHSMVAMPVRT